MYQLSEKRESENTPIFLLFICLLSFRWDVVLLLKSWCFKAAAIVGYMILWLVTQLDGYAGSSRLVWGCIMSTFLWSPGGKSLEMCNISLTPPPRSHSDSLLCSRKWQRKTQSFTLSNGQLLLTQRLMLNFTKQLGVLGPRVCVCVIPSVAMM